MADTEHNAFRLRETEELAEWDSPIHALHPLAKLLVTVFYIFVTVSFHKYDLSGVIMMAVYPAVIFSVSGIPVKTCICEMRFVLPVICAVGIFNPFFDRRILLHVGRVAISGGMVSMVTLMLKGAFCLAASFLLAATTSVDAVCAALRRLHVPWILVSLLLLTYRYVSVMAEEVAVMTMAYQLRAPGQRGIHISAWGSFLGQLLLRSMDRAQELYDSMRLRGFDGEFGYVDAKKFRLADFLFCAGCIALFVICRYGDVAEKIGGMFL